MNELKDKIKESIKDIPDFPKQGIIFKDITPIFLQPKLVSEMTEFLKRKYSNKKIDAVAGIESRGFLLGLPLAIALDVPFVLIRKKGKLPGETLSYKYELEYGYSEIEIHRDAIKQGQKVLIHDDLLATGGSAVAAAELVQMAGGEIAGFDFIITLNFLKGDKRLKNYSNNICSFVNY